MGREPLWRYGEFRVSDVAWHVYFMGRFSDAAGIIFEMQRETFVVCAERKIRNYDAVVLKLELNSPFPK